MSKGIWLVGATACPDCGKVRYLTRSAAKKASRLYGGKMSPYRCGEFWHCGHLPPQIRRGMAPRGVLG